MKRVLKAAILAVASAVLLATSGTAWYALSPPPVENLPLAAELISITSAEGQRLLASSTNTDYGQLAPHLVGQIRRAFCGPATSVALINAALRPQPAVTQASLFNAGATAVKSELALSVGGLTLAELAAFLRAHGLQVQVVHASQSTPDSFRKAARTTLAEPSTFLVVNYDRKVLRQSGSGHISPVAAFSPQADRLLVLDVATQKYPYTWVPVSLLWNAMNTVDSDSGQTRGYLLVTAVGRPHDSPAR